MKKNKFLSTRSLIKSAKFIQRFWLWLLLFCLAGLTLTVDDAAWAASIQAPHNQTVPTVTPTPEATPVPTVTPTPGPTASTSTDGSTTTSDETTSQPISTDLKATISVIVLNMRSADDTSSDIVGTANLDDEVSVIARNSAGTWLYVCCTNENSQPGWVNATFVETAFELLQTNELVPLYEEPAATPTPEADAPATPTAESVPTEAVEEDSSEDSPDNTDASDTASDESAVVDTEQIETELTEAEPTETESTETELTETESTESTSTEASVEATPTLAPATLQFEMRYTPEFIWQDQEVQIEFVVTNISDNPAVNVTIRDELVSELKYISANVEGDGTIETSTNSNGGDVFTITWPELAPQQQVKAFATVQISSELPSGAVIDNLAAAGADNASVLTGGMSVGMPPALLPEFR